MTALNTMGAFACVVLGLWGTYCACEWFAVACVRALAALLGG